MHELGLCDALLKKVDQIAKESELDGTPYAETKLIVNSVPGEAECLDCGKIFEADLEKLVCPACESLKLRPISGRDMTITEIEGY